MPPARQRLYLSAMKINRSTVFWVIAAAFVALLLFSTIRSQQVTCEVCVTFNGANRCAKASGQDRKAASQAAQTTACGPVASGMDQTIACGRIEPTSVTCSGD
jgi:hypothetical protein